MQHGRPTKGKQVNCHTIFYKNWSLFIHLHDASNRRLTLQCLPLIWNRFSMSNIRTSIKLRLFCPLLYPLPDPRYMDRLGTFFNRNDREIVTSILQYHVIKDNAYIGRWEVVTSHSARSSLELYCLDMANNWPVPLQVDVSVPFSARYFLWYNFCTGPRTGFFSPRSYVCHRAGPPYPPVMSVSCM